MKEINELSEKYLSELKKKSFTRLSQLEDYQEEKIVRNEHSYTIVIWKDTISATELRIVIQIYCYWILGIGNVHTDGFRTSVEGKISNLTEEDIFEVT